MISHHYLLPFLEGAARASRHRLVLIHGPEDGGDALSSQVTEHGLIPRRIRVSDETEALRAQYGGVLGGVFVHPFSPYDTRAPGYHAAKHVLSSLPLDTPRFLLRGSELSFDLGDHSLELMGLAAQVVSQHAHVPPPTFADDLTTLAWRAIRAVPYHDPTILVYGSTHASGLADVVGCLEDSEFSITVTVTESMALRHLDSGSHTPILVLVLGGLRGISGEVQEAVLSRDGLLILVAGESITYQHKDRSITYHRHLITTRTAEPGMLIEETWFRARLPNAPPARFTITTHIPAGSPVAVPRAQA